MTKRIVLPDRIGFTIVPSYRTYLESHGRSVTEPTWEERKNRTNKMVKFARLKGLNIYKPFNKSQLKVECPTYNKYIGNIQLGCYYPTITLQYNFLRRINTLEPSIGADKIKVHDDNYTLLSNSKLKLLRNTVYEKIDQDIRSIAKYVAGFFELPVDYTHSPIFINDIEWNTDVFVGENRSHGTLDAVRQYLVVENPNFFQDKGIIILERNDLAKDYNHQSIRYHCPNKEQIKIYCKTTNHLRFELKIPKKLLQKVTKCENHEVKKMLRELETYAKGKLRMLEIENLVGDKSMIVQKLKEVEELYLEQQNHLEGFAPGLTSLLEIMQMKGATSSEEHIKLIKENPYLNRLFLKVTNRTGQKVYIYCPERREKEIELRREARRRANHKGKESICGVMYEFS